MDNNEPKKKLDKEEFWKLFEDFENSVPLEDDKQAKLFLFREFQKLRELQDETNEKAAYLEAEEKRIVKDAKALVEKEDFFEKKMKILEQGFFVLDEDRKKIEYAKKQIEREKRLQEEEEQEMSERRRLYMDAFAYDDELQNAIFFSGIHSLQALKKRYKELMKIYHPDNQSGDGDTLLVIKREYELLLKMYSE